LSVTGAIDTLSKNGQQGPQYTWVFDNTSVGGTPIETINTGSTPSVRHSPALTGEYKVTVKISDGMFTNTARADVYYAGGTVGGTLPD
jgi:hypothetical protein